MNELPDHIEVLARPARRSKPPVRADAELRDALYFRMQLIASANEGLIVYGPDLRYQAWNPFMEKLTGVLAKRARKLFDESVRRLKGLAVELRPPELDVLGLSAALRQHFTLVTSRAGVVIRFNETLGRKRLPEERAVMLFRFAPLWACHESQEARAAGQGRRLAEKTLQEACARAYRLSLPERRRKSFRAFAESQRPAQMNVPIEIRLAGGARQRIDELARAP